jgi:anti-sigma regulatory factor (Ser/Thr protein kinase)
MARAVVRESVTVAGRAERARVARAFTVGVLGPGHPCGDDAALLVSELFGNSVRHSGSGAKGETVTVAVRAADGVVRVEVTDGGGRGMPQLRPCGSEAEGGRGLRLVAELAASWGWRRRGGPAVHTLSRSVPASRNRRNTCSPSSVGDHVGSWATSCVFSLGAPRCCNRLQPGRTHTLHLAERRLDRSLKPLDRLVGVGVLDRQAMTLEGP